MKISISVNQKFRFYKNQKHAISLGFLCRLFAHVSEKLYLCISEDSPWPSTGAPTARRVYAKRNSKLCFCADKLRSPPSKADLPTSAKLGLCHLATR